MFEDNDLLWTEHLLPPEKAGTKNCFYSVIQIWIGGGHRLDRSVETSIKNVIRTVIGPHISPHQNLKQLNPKSFQAVDNRFLRLQVIGADPSQHLFQTVMKQDQFQ